MPESFAGAAADGAAQGRVCWERRAPSSAGDDIDRWLLEDLLKRAGRTAEECEEILPQLTALARQIKEGAFPPKAKAAAVFRCRAFQNLRISLHPE